MDSEYVVSEPADLALGRTVWSKSATFLAPLRSPPGILRRTRSGGGTQTSDLTELPEYVVASKLLTVDSTAKPLWNEAHLR